MTLSHQDKVIMIYCLIDRNIFIYFDIPDLIYNNNL